MKLYTLKIIYILFCLLLCAGCSSQNLKFLVPNQVTISDQDTPYGEPFIANNPKNTSELIIAGMFTKDFENNSPFNYDIAIFATNNGGKNWEKRATPIIPNSIAKGDPWLVWGENGKLYFSCVAFIKNNEEKLKQQAFAFYSNDDGKTWSKAFGLFKGTTGHDHPVITFNINNKYPVAVFTTGGKGLSSTQIELISYDFSDSKIIVHEAGNESNNNLGSGEYLSNNVFALIQTKGMNELRSVSSTNFGSTYIESTITENCIPYGFPMFDSDSSSNLYTVWSERADIGTQIFMSISSDLGQTWSDKTQISQNSESINLMPQIKINQYGEILILWVSPESDRKLDCYSVNFTVSTDMGKSFIQNSLSPEKFCSATKKNGAVVQKWNLGGDYFGIDTDSFGNFHISWVDSRTGINQIWYSKVSR